MQKRSAFQIIVATIAFLGTLTTSRAADPDQSSITIPPATEILARLNKNHPRLIATAHDFERLKGQVQIEAVTRVWHARLRERAERILKDPPSRYEIPDGLRLLSTSRRVLDRVYTLALLYRIGGDKQFVERAWQELQAAANFPDWNPRHFLDTAEMTHAFAIGYDWLFDVWSQEQRDTLRGAMLEKGLKVALASYRGAGSYGWWVKARHNWNQVCNGGIGLGALALADERPELAGEILHAGLQSLQLPMREFAPDGAWNEGPGYWNYATAYNVNFLAGLETALGTDFGLSAMPAFADTGLFPIYLTGPLGRTFNYADGSDGTIRAAQMFWLARKFNRPAYARYQRAIATPAALDVLWYDSRLDTAQAPELPLDKYFRGSEVATFRSGWAGRDALFVGFKAGDNKANHSNLDLGSFVLDALGVRWAVDLGADNYNLPGYFGKQRWTYYRMRAEGHNTLAVNPGAEPDQDPAAATRITRFQSKSNFAFAVADLTPAYAKQTRKVERGIALLDRKQVLIQDEVQSAQADLWWFLHTPAQVSLSDDGTTAMLSQGNVRLWARIVSPQQATFAVMEAQPLPGSPHPERQGSNQNVRKLAIHLAKVNEARLAVLVVPLRENEAAPTTLPKVSALAEW